MSTPTRRVRATVGRAWRSIAAPRNRWWLLLVLGVTGLVLGYVGLREMAQRRGGDTSPLTLLYNDFALLSFSTGSTGDDASIPWQFEVARFLLPFVVIYGAFSGVKALFRDRFEQARLPFLRRHVVVVGLGRKGAAFAEAMRATRTDVVAIEIDPANAEVALARERGIIVVVGDAREPDALVAAGVRRARHLLVTADDHTNLEVVAVAQDLSMGRRSAPLECLAHASDSGVCALLKAAALERPDGDRCRVDFFNYHDQAARRLIDLEPPNGRDVVIVGSGPLVEHVVLHALEHRSALRHDEWTRATIVAPDAPRTAQVVVARWPALAHRARLCTVATSLDAAALGRLDVWADAPHAVVYAGDGDEDLNLAVALALRHRATSSGSRIVAVSEHGSALARFLEPQSHGPSPVRAVALGRETCTRALVEEGIVELLGRSIHELYVESRIADGGIPADDEALARWDELAESLRASNRAQAAHVGAKLDVVRCGLVPCDDPSTTFEFRAEEVELLAEMEHQRWVDERRGDGWRFGPERDVAARVTPYLVRWQDLDEEIRDRDREAVVRLPAQMIRAGFAVVRLDAPDRRVVKR